MVDSLYTAVGWGMHNTYNISEANSTTLRFYRMFKKSPYTQLTSFHRSTFHDMAWLYMPWQPSVAMNMWPSHSASTPKGHTVLLLLEHSASLTVADVGNYSTQKHLVARVWVHKKPPQVKWWVTWWHCFSSDLECQLFNCGKSKPLHTVMWQILLNESPFSIYFMPQTHPHHYYVCLQVPLTPHIQLQ